jgi:cysteine synthase A
MPQTLSIPTIQETVGRTPLVRLQRILPEKCATVLLKAEPFNPMASVKDRIAGAMIDDAIARGALKPGMTIIEATSGNTGIALAFIAAAHGYPLILTMPESMSLERRGLLRNLGAEIVLTPADKGVKGAIAAAQELVDATPNCWQPCQFENPANPAVHEATTGPEIWEACDGDIDAFITGVGTGGTLTGVGRFLRAQKPSVGLWAVEPADSPVISGGEAGPHGLPGIGAGFIPDNLDQSLLDGVLTATTEEAYTWARRLAREEGIFGGVSTGANLAAAIKLGQRPEWQGKTIVTTWCSFGERYLSLPLYADEIG